MKENYQRAEMELDRFQVDDVIETSGGVEYPDEGLLGGDAPSTRPQPTSPTYEDGQATGWS